MRTIMIAARPSTKIEMRTYGEYTALSMEPVAQEGLSSVCQADAKRRNPLNSISIIQIQTGIQ